MTNSRATKPYRRNYYNNKHTSFEVYVPKPMPNSMDDICIAPKQILVRALEVLHVTLRNDSGMISSYINEYLGCVETIYDSIIAKKVPERYLSTDIHTWVASKSTVFSPVVRALVAFWPLYSGDANYPVPPSNLRLSACDSWFMATQHYARAQGAMRANFVKFVIDFLKYYQRSSAVTHASITIRSEDYLNAVNQHFNAYYAGFRLRQIKAPVAIFAYYKYTASKCYPA